MYILYTVLLESTIQLLPQDYCTASDKRLYSVWPKTSLQGLIKDCCAVSDTRLQYIV